jgi:hypothetical protein
MKLGYAIAVISLTLSLINFTSDNPSLFGALTLIIGLFAIVFQMAESSDNGKRNGRDREQDFEPEIHELSNYDNSGGDGGSVGD